MNTEVMDNFNLNDTEAPENKEKVYVTPGFRRLTVEKFVYEKEEDGKTPLIVMVCKGTEDGDGSQPVLEEKLYMSGKLNKQNVMSSVVRLQELYKGLTGNPKMTITPSAYTYTKKEKDGSSQTFRIPNPEEICAFLNSKCAGKSAIFKVGGDEGREGQIFAKLTYSGFLYYTNKKSELCMYKEERDFTDSEYKYAVQKKKEIEAPAGNSGMVNEEELSQL